MGHSDALDGILWVVCACVCHRTYVYHSQDKFAAPRFVTIKILSLFIIFWKFSARYKGPHIFLIGFTFPFSSWHQVVSNDAHGPYSTPGSPLPQTVCWLCLPSIHCLVSKNSILLLCMRVTATVSAYWYSFFWLSLCDPDRCFSQVTI